MQQGGKTKLQMEIKKPLINTKLKAKVQKKTPSSLSVTAQARSKGKAVQRDLLHRPHPEPKVTYHETLKGKTYSMGITPKRSIKLLPKQMKRIYGRAVIAARKAPGKVKAAATTAARAAKKKYSQAYIKAGDAREELARATLAIKKKVQQMRPRRKGAAAPPPRKGADSISLDQQHMNQMQQQQAARQIAVTRQLKKPRTLPRPGTPQASVVLEQQRVAAQLAYVYRPVKFDIATGVLGAGFAVVGQAYKLQQDKQYPAFAFKPSQQTAPLSGQQPVTEQHFYYYPAEGTQTIPMTGGVTRPKPAPPGPVPPPPVTPPLLTPPIMGPPLTPPVLPRPSLPPSGAWQSWARKMRRASKQKKGYTPSATAMAFSIKGKASKAGARTGMGLRPIVPRKKKKKGGGVF